MADAERQPQRSTQVARLSQGMIPTDSSSVDSERHTAVKGSVYLIVNDLIPSRVKIGYTTRDPIERASELVTTGTTGTFVVIYQALVLNPYAVEQEVHRRLRNQNCGLEWFEVCPNRAKEEILAVAGEVLYEDTTPRWHRSQPEPSNKTKELLREAKQAADERRRREEENARQVRLAAEEARIKQAQEAAEAQRLADEEEYRQRAEERAREAAVEEDNRKRREQQLRIFAESEQQRARRMLYLWHLARWVAFLTAVVLAMGLIAYWVGGPYSPRKIAAVEKQCKALAADVESLRVALKSSADKVRLADRAREILTESRDTLEKELTEHLREKKITQLMLARSQAEYDKAKSRYGRDGRPIAGRDGLSASTIEAELAVRSGSFRAALKSYDDWQKKEAMLREEIAALPGRLEEVGIAAKEGVREVAAMQKELKAKEESVRLSQRAVSRMRAHNARFLWLRSVGIDM